jgi:hypothetical protein
MSKQALDIDVRNKKIEKLTESETEKSAMIALQIL